MMIKTLLARLIDPHKKTPEPEITVEPTPRIAAIEGLLFLEPERFSAYRAVSGTSVKFTPAFENIEQYAEALRKFAALVEHSRPIRASQLKPSDKEMTVEAFLVSNDGRYVDNILATGKLRTEGLELCRLLAKCENVESGFDEHNLRILTNLLTNVADTADALAQVSLMN